ncbi:MAG: sulfotransferase [Pseudomonadota bacterium]
MKLHANDYMLTRLSSQFASALVSFGDLETKWLGDNLQQKPITAPIFICGLARSGTTILLNVLSKADGIATHRYRDFPFVFVPSLWKRYQDRFAATADPVERPHKDRILITKESPDAFEEPIWQHFFPKAHDPKASHVLDRKLSNEEFEAFFQDHIRKILMLRGGSRYLSKGNYNVTRLDYLDGLFADPKFLVPIRHPFTHVHSLVTQHRRFTDYAKDDPRIPRYLEIAGHYEFGPQRIPIHVTADGARRIEECWRKGDDYRGYAILWAEVYRYVHELRSGAGSGFAERMKFVLYENLCGEPNDVLADVIAFVGLQDQAAKLAKEADSISAPPAKLNELPDAILNEVWEEVRTVAELFGYTRTETGPVVTPNTDSEHSVPTE